MTQYRHLLVYRRKKSHVFPLDWEEPTGGMVVDENYDRVWVEDIANERYRCRPDEVIVFLEADGNPELELQAKVLHAAWFVEGKQLREWLE